MDVLATIREYIEKELLGEATTSLQPRTPLLDKGYLTSLQAVELVIFLEQRFSTTIDPEEVTEENFRDLSSIAALVASKGGAS